MAFRLSIRVRSWYSVHLSRDDSVEYNVSVYSSLAS